MCRKFGSTSITRTAEENPPSLAEAPAPTELEEAETVPDTEMDSTETVPDSERDLAETDKFRELLGQRGFC